MYVPKHFMEQRSPELHEFLRAHPLATLIVHTEAGLLANHIPLLLRTNAEGLGQLHGHVARANPLWKAAGASLDCLAIFHGPERYISPNWYASKAQDGEVVPTWNYEVLHVHGQLRSIDDAAWVRMMLEALTLEHENALVSPWRPDQAPQEYIDQKLASIVGLEIQIESMQGKAKLSQNQPQLNRESLVLALQAQGDAASLSMAERIRARANTQGERP